MTKAARIILSLFFGIAAFISFLVFMFTLLDGPSGPNFRPVAGIVALMLGVATAIAAYAKTTAMLGIFGLNGNLSTSVAGRLFVVATVAFSIFFVYAVTIDEDYIFLSFIPVLLVILGLVGRWILRGNQSNA